ncbi:hypothetical protein [Zooshikella harenae]|uniref:Uncharacterized protein n=1 Tax=Zooshikella harenae TaxID=2827238 RepID=A0ABS5ZJA3_9GAMM|nr:hypothetical protein [Zooshikella harenae]MBU2714157.1 hypothetical protein [Zooshikella harenae]
MVTTAVYLSPEFSECLWSVVWVDVGSVEWVLRESGWAVGRVGGQPH